MNKKVIGNLFPFNEVMYKDCFYHAVLPIFRLFTGSIDPLLFNDICLEYCASISNGIPSLKMKNVGSNSMDIVFEKYGISVRKSVIQSEYLIDHIVQAINQNKIVVLRIDCYYEPLRKDSYHEYHAGHVIPVYGYNLENKTFRILEGDFIDSVVYSSKELEFNDLKNSYEGYLNNFHTDNYTFYTFEKIKKTNERNLMDSRNSFVQMISEHFGDYYNSIENLKKYKKMINDYLKKGYNSHVSEIVTESNKLIDEVVVQKYIFAKLFDMTSEYDSTIDETIRLWKSIRAILTKYMFKKSMNDKSIEMLNEMLEQVYYNELKRYNLLEILIYRIA